MQVKCLVLRVSSRVLDTGEGLLEGQIKRRPALHLLISAPDWDSTQPRRGFLCHWGVIREVAVNTMGLHWGPAAPLTCLVNVRE